MLKEYYWLTKPGIIYGNALTATAGFLLASKDHFDLWLFLYMIFGLSFIIASACVFNNLFDRDIDERMERTRSRALVSGAISKQSAIIFATVLGIAGSLILNTYTNPAALTVALTGLFFYVAIYTPLKRRTVWGTFIGAIPGAVPPVVGYVAVIGQFDLAAWILFLILVSWQMPHFYAISIYRYSDYSAARLPVLPVQKGIKFTKITILFFIAIFIAISSMLTVFKYTGLFYLVLVSLFGLTWLWFGIRDFNAATDKLWGRKMFRFSLIVLLLLSVMISIDVV